MASTRRKSLLASPASECFSPCFCGGRSLDRFFSRSSCTMCSGSARFEWLARSATYCSKRSLVTQARCGCAECLDKAHQLPALRFRKFRPIRHATPYDSIAENPEERPRCRLSYRFAPQARTPFRAFGLHSVASRAMLLKKLSSRRKNIRVAGKRVRLCSRLLWGVRKLSIAAVRRMTWICLRRSASLSECNRGV